MTTNQPEQGRLKRLPLTTAQAPLWLEQLYFPGKPIANTGLAVSLHGKLEVSVFAEALRRVIAETDTLRIRLEMAGEAVHQAIVDLPNYCIEQIDFSQADDPAGVADAWIETHLWQTIAWDSFPLFKYTLIKIGAEHHIWLLKSNHLVIDGLGRLLLVERTAEIYEALRNGTPIKGSGGASAAQVVAVNEQYLASDSHKRDLDYFVEKFQTLPDSLIRTDLKQGEKAITGRSTRILREISRGDFHRLRSIAKEADCSVPQIFLALVFVSLHRLYRLNDLAIGFAQHNRTTPAIRRTIALFTQNLPIRLSISAETLFSDFIHQLNAEIERARPHSRLPPAELGNVLKSGRQGRGLYDVLFNYIPPAAKFAFEQLSAQTVTLSHGFFLPLIVTCSHPDEHSPLRLTLDYDQGLVDEDEAHRLIESLHVLCTTIGLEDLKRPIDTLQMVDAARRTFLLESLNQTSISIPEGTTLPGLFRKQVDRTPDAVAIICGEQQVTFAELHSRVLKLAAQLSDIGIAPGNVIGIALTRNINLMVGLLAVHEVGAAYLPLDLAYPAERLRYLVDDSNASLVLADSSTMHLLPPLRTRIAPLEELRPPQTTDATSRRPQPDDLAYVLYTSGSTGRPKGVGVEHRNVVNFITCMRSLVQDEDLEGILFSTSLNFDISVYEIFLPLLFGGKMVMVDNLLALPDAEARDAVRLINTGPSLMAALLKLGWTPRHVRTINLCGEPLTRNLADAIFQANPELALFNMYGPTETTVYSTYARVPMSDDRAPAIGRPLWNTQVYVLGPQGGLLPKGVAGELYIGGAGVTRGYLGRPDLTRDRFIDNPFGEGKLYRTGDLVRWRSDDELEYLRRDDRQIKIHGQRVELGEIEKQIEALPGIQSGVVLAQPDSTGGHILHAYAISKSGPNYDLDQFVSELSKVLPRHMLPTSLTWMNRFPMLPNGKLDRKAFLIPQAAFKPESSRAPSTEVEKKLVEIWKEILELKEVSIEDNFYDLGGTSLQGFMIFARIGQRLKVNLPPATMLQAPSVVLQARFIERASDDDGNADGLLVRFRAGGSREPLFMVHDGWGGIMFLRELANLLRTDRAIYGLRPPALDGRNPLPRTIEETATLYIAQIRRQQPRGPYQLCGYSFGGFVAFEMARQLTAGGEEVHFVGIIDASKAPEPTIARSLLAIRKGELPSLLRKTAHAGVHYMRSLGEEVTAWRNSARLARGLPLETPAVHQYYRSTFRKAVRRYTAQIYSGKVTVFAGDNKERLHDARWRKVTAAVEVREIGGSHTEIVGARYNGVLASHIDETLDAHRAATSKY